MASTTYLSRFQSKQPPASHASKGKRPRPPSHRGSGGGGGSSSGGPASSSSYHPRPAADPDSQLLRQCGLDDAQLAERLVAELHDRPHPFFAESAFGQWLERLAPSGAATTSTASTAAPLGAVLAATWEAVRAARRSGGGAHVAGSDSRAVCEVELQLLYDQPHGGDRQSAVAAAAPLAQCQALRDHCQRATSAVPGPQLRVVRQDFETHRVWPSQSRTEPRPLPQYRRQRRGWQYASDRPKVSSSSKEHEDEEEHDPGLERGRPSAAAAAASARDVRSVVAEDVHKVVRSRTAAAALPRLGQLRLQVADETPADGATGAAASVFQPHHRVGDSTRWVVATPLPWLRAGHELQVHVTQVAPARQRHGQTWSVEVEVEFTGGRPATAMADNEAEDEACWQVAVVMWQTALRLHAFLCP